MRVYGTTTSPNSFSPLPTQDSTSNSISLQTGPTGLANFPRLANQQQYSPSFGSSSTQSRGCNLTLGKANSSSPSSTFPSYEKLASTSRASSSHLRLATSPTPNSWAKPQIFINRKPFFLCEPMMTLERPRSKAKTIPLGLPSPTRRPSDCSRRS